MGDMIMQDSQLIEHLNRLIELDLDAIEAYEAAIARLNDPSDKAQLERFREDHRRHTAELSSAVEEVGGTAATRPDFKRVLTKGKVVVAGLVGDRAVLTAMKSNEETTTKTYDKATREAGVPIRVKTLLERNFADEQKHLAWIEQRLAQNTSERMERQP
jgi:uncharacterized protein (TIGR02284 family)